MTEESEIKKKIKDYLESVGAFWSAVPEGSYAKPGDPDMIACYRGRFIGIEGKTPRGAQRPIQKRREKEIIAAGGIYILARSVDDVKDVIDMISDDDGQ